MGVRIRVGMNRIRITKKVDLLVKPDPTINKKKLDLAPYMVPSGLDFFFFKTVSGFKFFSTLYPTKNPEPDPLPVRNSIKLAFKGNQNGFTRLRNLLNPHICIKKKDTSGYVVYDINLQNNISITYKNVLVFIVETLWQFVGESAKKILIFSLLNLKKF